MRFPLVLLAIAAAALGPAAAAPAKEIEKVTVCGADGCQDVTDRTTMALAEGGPPTAPPDGATPFYRVKVSMSVPEGETIPGWSFLWVPAAEMTAHEDGTWTSPPSTAADELKAATRGIEPLPAAKLVLPEPVPAEAPAAAPAPAQRSVEGGLPAAAVVLIVAGALGLVLALARGAAALGARRRGAASPG